MERANGIAKPSRGSGALVFSPVEAGELAVAECDEGRDCLTGVCLEEVVVPARMHWN
jgi:hypothetical protein